MTGNLARALPVVRFVGITIHDNGVGIAQELAAETLTSIGASKKRYQHEAGFRGIGRLAGIAFSDAVHFRTKAKGETRETTVTFDGKGLRKDMSPSNLSPFSLKELLRKHVRATVSGRHSKDAHFFEVVLEGFTTAAPAECTDIDAMRRFVGQIAPVPYRKDFPLRTSIHGEAKSRRHPIEETNVYVGDGEAQTQVFKPYGRKYAVGANAVEITEHRIFRGKHWWAWVGMPTESGAIKNEECRGLRIRVRNIQIDETHITSNIFANLKQRTSYTRFNDWYIGEIFIDPAFLVPNARRDAFEDDDNWLIIREELSSMCDALGKQAYATSKKLQQSVESLTEEVRKLETEHKKLSNAGNANIDEFIHLSSSTTKVHRLIARAMKTEEAQALAQLRSLENRVTDIKTKAVKQIGAVSKYDVEEIQQEAKDELLDEVIAVLKEELDPKTFSKVARILNEHFGRDEN
ncbi:MAG: ATP-binding protein [Burkholderiales bacterium]|nr:ATP-binding protein [Burkholderiales bacterium]